MTGTRSLGASEIDQSAYAGTDEHSGADFLFVESVDRTDSINPALTEPEAVSSITKVPQTRLKLLLIGDDPDLLNTRALVLSSVGYDVESFSGGEALESRPFARFDGLLICHSIPETKAVLLATLMRCARPNAHIIRLSRFPCTESASFTSVCGTMHSPADFVADVNAILGDRLRPTPTARSIRRSMQR